MFKYLLSLLALLILLSGCGHKIGVLKEDKQQFAGEAKNGNFAIIGFKSNHLGSFFRNQTTKNMEPFLWAITTLLDANPLSYKEKLDRECLANMQSELSRNTFFNFVPSDKITNLNEETIPAEDNAIAKILAKNGLAGGIGVKIE